MKWVWKKETCGWYSHSCFDKLERWQCHFLTQGIQKQITDWGNDDEFHLSMVRCLHNSCWRRQRTLRRWDLSKDSTLETEFHNTILWPLTWFSVQVLTLLPPHPQFFMKTFNSLSPPLFHQHLLSLFSPLLLNLSWPSVPISSNHTSQHPTWLIEIFTFLYYMITN